MRFLNKIVFINSAHVPYGEIGLEGNVHLTGTQGVGKSTLLRAILFFYTADKTRLGIPQGKKGFDEYYFSHPNSYIVYNVGRDEGAYTILAFKHQGRVAFRFVNAPFSKEWIIDENGKALSEFPQIRERIGKKYEISNIIQSYDTYKNIIFGNNKSHDMIEFKKYALTESTKYQNIPRTIQNVFLNTKLDAEFIKTTIIRSMQEEESIIDIDYFRNQVAGFEEEYNDVKRWYTPDKNGHIRVKQQAEDVTNIFTQYTVNQREALDVFRELQFSKRSYDETLPEAKAGRANLLVHKQNLESEKRDKNAAFEARKNELNKELGAIEQKLKEIQEKKKYYSEIKIDEIIKHVQSGVQLQAEYEQLNNTYNALTNKHQDIEKKYQNLISELDLSVKNFEHKENERLDKKRANHYEITKKLYEKAELKFNEFREDSLNKTNELDNKINANKQVIYEKKLCINSLNKDCPFNAENKEIEDKLKKLQEEENRNRETSYKLKHEYEKTTQECENEIRKIITEKDKNIRELLNKKDSIVAEIKKLEGKIINYKGSFAEWLTINKTDWANNIGKIINEETLYLQNLKPQKVNSNNESLYGVQIDLSFVSSHSRSIEELTTEINDKKIELKNIEETIQNVQCEYDTKCDKIKKNYSEKNSELTKQLNLCTIELNNVEPKKKRLLLEQKEINDKIGNWQKEQTVKLEKEIEEYQQLNKQLIEEKFHVLDDEKKRQKT
ncbi:MAG: ATP-binding protein [Paludibacteraceae bacterium]|nr:ATP-binding protein [Paludibacteraceae bacterium]